MIRVRVETLYYWPAHTKRVCKAIVYPKRSFRNHKTRTCVKSFRFGEGFLLGLRARTDDPVLYRNLCRSPSGRDFEPDSDTPGHSASGRGRACDFLQTSPSDYLTTARTSRLTSSGLSGAFELRAPGGNIWRVRATTEKRRPLVFRANFVVFYCRA